MTEPSSQVVILGHTGFIGKALFDHLHKSGDVTVRGFASSTVDLTEPYALRVLSEVLEERTTLVLASAITLDRAVDSLDLFTANTAMVTNLARCLETRAIGKCVYFSTVSVYGDAVTHLSITEQSPIAPTTYYAAAKYAGECILQQVAQRMGFPLLILRPCRVDGPGALHANYGPGQFIRSILHHGCVQLYGDGSELRDHVYIDDLVRITHDLMRGDFSGIYNLASGQSHTYRQVVDSLQRILPQRFRIVHRLRTRPRIDQGFDLSKLFQAIPHVRFTPIEESLRATYDSYAQAASVVV